MYERYLWVVYSPEYCISVCLTLLNFISRVVEVLLRNFVCFTSLFIDMEGIKKRPIYWGVFEKIVGRSVLLPERIANPFVILVGFVVRTGAVDNEHYVSHRSCSTSGPGDRYSHGNRA